MKPLQVKQCAESETTKTVVSKSADMRKEQKVKQQTNQEKKKRNKTKEKTQQKKNDQFVIADHRSHTIGT
jgi:hypothetical protein